MSNILFHIVFALIGIVLGGLQCFLLWSVIKYITSSNPLPAMVFLMAKLLIYAVVFTLAVFFARDGIIALGAGLGTALFVFGAVLSAIKIKKQ